MKKTLLLFSILFIAFNVHAQIEFAKLIGKNSEYFSLGYGASLKLGIPVSDVNAVTAELGALIFRYKDFSDDGLVIVPLKAGFKHFFDESGYGFYAEPQAGYTLFAGLEDEKVNGVILGAVAGHLFKPWGKIELDLSLRYETILAGINRFSYIGLRLGHNFSLGRKKSEE